MLLWGKSSGFASGKSRNLPPPGYGMHVTRLERDGEELKLPCEGLRVSQIRIDYAFGLELAEDQERASDEPWRIRINTRFHYSAGDTAATAIDPERPAPEAAAALAVRHQTLTLGRISRTGRLRLEFAKGDVIEVPADDRYEAWEATGGTDSDRMILVSPIAPDTYW